MTPTSTKFSGTGQFLLQIGAPGKMEGPDSQTTLNRPAAVAVDDAANEVYVADSGNHRVVVFDADTGAYKRHWGALWREKPTAGGGGPSDPNAAPAARQFRDVTCVKISKDGMVYVCDRSSDRIQVFQKDGKFVKEAIIAKETTGATVSGQFGVVSSHGSVWDVAFSDDPAAGKCVRRRRAKQDRPFLSATRWRRWARLGAAAACRQFLVVSTVAVRFAAARHHWASSTTANGAKVVPAPMTRRLASGSRTRVC